jgi:hypothetical protein
VALAAVAVTAAPARAETLTVAAGGDPVAGLPNGVDYEYDTGGVQLGLELLARPADGPPCQPTIVMDHAAVNASGGSTPVTSAPLQLSGNGLGRVPFTFAAPGRWRVCGWLYRTPDDVVVAAANEADVRAPAVSLAVTAEEVGPSAGGADLRVRVTGSAESALDVYTMVVPGGATCPGSYDEDTQPTAMDVLPAGTPTRVSGAFALGYATHDRLGFQRWRVCAYLQDGASADRATAVASAVVDLTLRPTLLRRPKVRAAKGVLTCDGGRFRARPVARITYAWLRGGRPVPGAKARTLRVSGKMKGKPFACRVTAVNALGKSTATSRAIRAR